MDHRIIEILREDGRQSNQDIARRLDVTAATVRSRIRRMEENALMRVVAVTDFAAAGYDLLLAVGVVVEGRSPEAVAREIAEVEDVFSVNVVTGAVDIEVLVAARDFARLSTLLTRKLSGIAGIGRLEPGVAVDVLKYQFDAAPLS